MAKEQKLLSWVVRMQNNYKNTIFYHFTKGFGLRWVTNSPGVMLKTYAQHIPHIYLHIELRSYNFHRILKTVKHFLVRL